MRLLEVSSEAYDEKVDTGLKDLITGPMRQAITYRSEKKRIVRFQVELANFMKELLMEASGLRLQAARMGEPVKLLTKYKTLYCQLLPLEAVQMSKNEKGKMSFTKKKDEEAYFYRRIHMADYLKTIGALIINS